MTKKLIAAALALMLTTALYVPVRAEENVFSDVTPQHWSYLYVSRAAKAGVVSGMGDGSFLPDDTLTFAQFVSIIVRACRIGTTAADGAPWYEGYIEAAKAAGLLGGVGENAPDDAITRYDMAKIVYSSLKLMGYEPLGAGEIAETLEKIPDELPEDCAEAVAGVYALGVIQGVDGQGSFAGDGLTTRAQGAVIYCRMTAALESCVSVGGAVFRIGMSAETLAEKAGAPDETLSGVMGWEWRVYRDGYKTFFAAAVSGGEVAALLAAGDGFVYSGFRPGDTDAAVSSRFVELLTDKNDGGALYGVYISKEAVVSEPDLSFGALYGEARLNFHLVNAFRGMHGLSVLEWSDTAAQAGKLHCADMAQYGYFAHEGRDGSSPTDRIAAQGIVYRAVGENLYTNTSPFGGGTEAFARLVDSSGHRETMMYADFEYLGVSCVSGPDGSIYLAEEFYKSR